MSCEVLGLASLRCVALLVLLTNCCSAQLQHLDLSEDDNCPLGGNGGVGICKNFNSCPGAVQALRMGTFPLICSFDGIVPIVCCSTVTTRISERKCNIYQGLAEEESATTTTTTTTTAQPFLAPHFPEWSPNVCELPNNGLISGGVNASLGEFPHMAAVGYIQGNETQWNCGGSLISERFVLTAAHCIYTQAGPARVVRLGEHDISKDADGASPVNYEIEELIVHPDYHPRSSKYHDIGLLKLKKDVTFTRYIRPACLPNQPIIRNKTTAVGWGRTIHHNGPRATVLQKVGLNLVSNADCNEKYLQLPPIQFNAIIPRGIISSIICAGDTKDKDTCPGDSGGPLQQKKDSICSYTILGITSFGFICGQGQPAVYTRVSSYLDWIEEIVWP